MTNDFATGMRRALEKYRAIDPAVATSLVQEVLGANGIALPGGLDRQPTRALLENPFSSLMRDRCQPSAGGGLVQGLNLPGLSGRPAGVTIEVPEGARYERRQHSSPAGSRKYTL